MSMPQEDGTLEALLGETAALTDMLEALCGVTRAKEGDAEVRISLAESIEMLVSFIASCNPTYLSFKGAPKAIHPALSCFSIACACVMQVSTEQGKEVLWDLKAPEMLRKG